MWSFILICVSVIVEWTHATSFFYFHRSSPYHNFVTPNFPNFQNFHDFGHSILDGESRESKNQPVYTGFYHNRVEFLQSQLGPNVATANIFPSVSSPFAVQSDIGQVPVVRNPGLDQVENYQVAINHPIKGNQNTAYTYSYEIRNLGNIPSFSIVQVNLGEGGQNVDTVKVNLDQEEKDETVKVNLEKESQKVNLEEHSQKIDSNATVQDEKVDTVNVPMDEGQLVDTTVQPDIEVSSTVIEPLKIKSDLKPSGKLRLKKKRKIPKVTRSTGNRTLIRRPIKRENISEEASNVSNVIVKPPSGSALTGKRVPEVIYEYEEIDNYDDEYYEEYLDPLSNHTTSNSSSSQILTVTQSSSKFELTSTTSKPIPTKSLTTSTTTASRVTSNITNSIVEEDAEIVDDALNKATTYRPRGSYRSLNLASQRTNQNRSNIISTIETKKVETSTKKPIPTVITTTTTVSSSTSSSDDVIEIKSPVHKATTENPLTKSDNNTDEYVEYEYYYEDEDADQVTPTALTAINSSKAPEVIVQNITAPISSATSLAKDLKAPLKNITTTAVPVTKTLNDSLPNSKNDSLPVVKELKITTTEKTSTVDPKVDYEEEYYYVEEEDEPQNSNDVIHGTSTTTTPTTTTTTVPTTTTTVPTTTKSVVTTTNAPEVRTLPPTVNVQSHSLVTVTSASSSFTFITTTTSNSKINYATSTTKSHLTEPEAKNVILSLTTLETQSSKPIQETTTESSRPTTYKPKINILTFLRRQPSQNQNQSQPVESTVTSVSSHTTKSQSKSKVQRHRQRPVTPSVGNEATSASSTSSTISPTPSPINSTVVTNEETTTIIPKDEGTTTILGNNRRVRIVVRTKLKKVPT